MNNFGYNNWLKTEKINENKQVLIITTFLMPLIIVMSNEKYIIKKQFLERRRYEQLLTHTYEYEEVFKTWLGQITDYYRGAFKPELINIIQKGMSSESSEQGFHHLVYPFVNTLYNVSTQHMIYVTSVMRQSASMSLQRDADKMLEKIVKLGQSQFMVESTHRDILSSENRMTLQPAHNIQFYSFSNWFKKLNVLEKYGKSIKLLEEAKKNKQQLYSLSEQLQYELLEFRKKIINYKYGYFKQGVKTARKLLSCLSEYFSIGIQILKKINGKYRMEMVNENRNSKQMRYSRGQVVDHLQDFQQNYAPKSQAYRATLTNIQNLFIDDKIKVDKQALFFKFREMYSGNESLLDQIFDVYELFETMNKKRKIMFEKISSIISAIQAQHKNKKKTAQVLGALNRKKTVQIEGRNLALSGSLQRSQQFNQQFGMENIEKMISEAVGFSLKCFTEMSQVCYKLTYRITEQLKADRSGMEVSYQYTEVKIKNKRPSKEEVWLWKDWREFRVFEDVSPKYDEKYITNELNFIRKVMQKEQSQQKFQCQVQGRHKGKAVLNIYPDKVAVQGKKQNSNYFILPYKNIDCIESSKKKLVFKMSGGCELKLLQFKNVVQVEKKINQHFVGNQGTAVNGATADAQIQSAPATVFSPEQLQAIQKRAPQIEAIRPKIKEYTKYGETKLPGVTIQEVYQFIFSDKDSCPVSPTTSFFKYTNTKNKNTNITETKYNAEGPYFYTGTNKNITFLNAPLFSTRQSGLDHPLPPIPFLPKSIHCKSKEKLIWISNKEFEYVADVHSEGHKMMQSFFTSTIYHVNELSQGGVNLEILCKIQFIKDASMKSILVNGAVSEIKKIVPDIIKEIQKCCKVGIRLRAKQTTQGGATTAVSPDEGIKILQELQKSEIKVPSTTPDNQKITVNYYSIILLVIGTIVLNLLVNWLF